MFRFLKNKLGPKNENKFCTESDPDLCPGLFHKDEQGQIFKSVPEYAPNVIKDSSVSLEIYKTQPKYRWEKGNEKPVDDINHNIYVHDNGSRPFKLKLTNKSVVISECDYSYRLNFYSPVLKINNPSEIFIGRKPPNMQLDMIDYPGNTVLIRLANGNYLYIASRIYKFTPSSSGSITEFYSYVGNNDVPYPFARDDTYTYLFAYRQMIKNSFIDVNKDPYGENLKNAEPMQLTEFLQKASAPARASSTLKKKTKRNTRTKGKSAQKINQLMS